jgi:hypothetical protein
MVEEWWRTGPLDTHLTRERKKSDMLSPRTKRDYRQYARPAVELYFSHSSEVISWWKRGKTQRNRLRPGFWHQQSG